MTILHLDPRWLPTTAAAAELGLHVRTLQRRARAGRIETRTSADGRTLYAVPATGADATTPATQPPAAPHHAAPLDRLERLMERALRAELELEHARAELERVTAAARDLEARHVRRGQLLRQLARQLGTR